MSGFKKNDLGKLKWHLMPEPALEEVLKVLQLGAETYGEFNWVDNANEVKWTRYLNAIERHLKKFKRGQNIDEDSGLQEMAHIACNALFLITYVIQNKGTDDRRKDK